LVCPTPTSSPGSLIERVTVPSSRSRLLTTSKTAEALHPAKIPNKSLSSKTLPVTLMRSRLCRASFKMTQCFQDFPRYRGRGVYPRLHLIRCNPGMRRQDYQSANIPLRILRRHQVPHPGVSCRDGDFAVPARGNGSPPASPRCTRYNQKFAVISPVQRSNLRKDTHADRCSHAPDGRVDF